MSGGHWNYAGERIRGELEYIAADGQMQARFPRLTRLLSKLSDILYECEHDIDWDFSGDKHIANDSLFERTTILKVLLAADNCYWNRKDNK